MSPDRRTNQIWQTLFHTLYPGVIVTDLRCTAETLAVAFDALCLDNFFSSSLGRWCNTARDSSFTRTGRIVHVEDRGTQFAISKIGLTAAGWHTPVSPYCRTDQIRKPLFYTLDPGFGVTDLRRATQTLTMAFDTLRQDDFFSASLSSEFSRTCRLDPVATRLIDHVGNSTCNFQISQFRMTTVRGHLANPFESVRRQTGKALGSATAPGIRVTNLGRTVDTSRVTSGADRINHFLAASRTFFCIHRREHTYHGQRE